jgi:peptidase E
MSAAKPAFLLAGGRPRDPSNTIRALSRALGESGKAKPRVAYLGVASGDNLLFFNAVKALLKKAGAGDVVMPRLAKAGADLAEAKKILEAADVVFITGGEVEDGMVWLNRHGLADFVRELYSRGKLFLGMSAGSIMMGAHWVRWEDEDNDDTASLFDCLGIIPATFDTHAEDEDWKELKAALKLMGPGARGYGIPRDGMISADSMGTLVNLEKELLCYVNNGGHIERL